jgi:arginine-tRNA-protein transferase
MNLLQEFSLEEKCSYLEGMKQTTHYKVIENCGSANSQALIERGYRRFGKMYFRPICSDCRECQSIKIDVANYTFSKSARRILKKAHNVKSYIQTPTMTQEHIALFKKYHLFMQDKKGWNYNEISPQHYYNSFVVGHENYGHEVLYFLEGKLIGVDLIDILDDGISSIYFYYDPEYAYLSLGKFSLYNQIKYAQHTEKKWIYLGYYVQECPSLSYKAQYKPYLTLKGRPNRDDSFEWE